MRVEIGQKKGMTIAELVISSAIFIMVITAVISLFAVSVDAARRVSYEYTATTLARSRIERLKRLDYSLLPDAHETDTRINEEGAPATDGLYERTTTVTEDYGGNTRLTKVDVDVYYYFRGTKNNSPASMTMLFVNAA